MHRGLVYFQTNKTRLGIGEDLQYTSVITLDAQLNHPGPRLNESLGMKGNEHRWLASICASRDRQYLCGWLKLSGEGFGQSEIQKSQPDPGLSESVSLDLLTGGGEGRRRGLRQRDVRLSSSHACCLRAAITCPLQGEPWAQEGLRSVHQRRRNRRGKQISPAPRIT